MLQSFLSTLLRSLQIELGVSTLVGLIAIGNQVPLSGLRGHSTASLLGGNVVVSAFLVPLKAEVTREKSNCSLSDQSPEAEEPQARAGKHRTKLPEKRFFCTKMHPLQKHLKEGPRFLNKPLRVPFLQLFTEAWFQKIYDSFTRFIQTAFFMRKCLTYY